MFPANALLALAPVNSWGLAEWAIAIVVFAAICGIVYVILTQCFGIAIPPWLITILWIVVGVLVAVLAIKFIAGIV